MHNTKKAKCHSIHTTPFQNTILNHFIISIKFCEVFLLLLQEDQKEMIWQLFALSNRNLISQVFFSQ